MRAARKIIDAHLPDRVITFGGDCLVSQAPFAYLNERYDGDIGIIWLDAHPDVTSPADFDHAHAMVLGNLLGEGEPLLAREVGTFLKPEQIVLAGVDGVLPHERDAIKRFGLERISSEDLLDENCGVTAWIRKQKFQRVAIHLDLDVLDPKVFRSLLFANPDVDEPIEAEHGKTQIRDIGRLLKEVASQVDVVGITFAEYMPWDPLNLKNMLAALPFMR